jgi:hypothetical protein
LKPNEILIGKIEWSLNIEFKRPNRNDDDTLSKKLDANKEWDIVKEFGKDFYGGKATLSATYKGTKYEQIFHIRGNDPTVQVAEKYISDNCKWWYAVPISRQEHGADGLQFNQAGTLGTDYLKNIQKTPNRSSDGEGWGIMQLTDPVPSRTQVWNWKENINEAIVRMNEHRKKAEEWIKRQEKQQKEEEPGKPLENYIFEFGGIKYQKGTEKTPTDACAIQRYNGAEQWVIYWKNKTADSEGEWKINEKFRDYVDAVSKHITN